MAATNKRQATFEDYEGFVEKFKPKKTTDDCYTPPAVYEAIKSWACKRYGIDPAKIVRPFYPGSEGLTQCFCAPMLFHTFFTARARDFHN